MAKDFQTIINDINSHLAKSGRRYYSDFYIGITDDVERGMFTEHNVVRGKSWWIYRTATDPDTAREIETHFLEKGMRGDKDKDKGDDTDKIVYCYAVSPITIE